MRTSAILVVCVACGSSSGEQVRATGADLCGAGDVDAICAEPPVPLTAGHDLASAPAITAGVSYAIAGPGPGKRGDVLFRATVSGEHTLYLGGPDVPFVFCDEVATCTSAAPGSCLRAIHTYDLVAGTYYEIEVGPLAAAARLRLRIDAPTTPSPERRLVIAAALDGQAEPDLYTLAPDGGDVARVTSTAAAELYPAWSPLQHRIAFIRDLQLFAIDPDGDAEDLLAARAGRERGTAAPAWSPNGAQLVYTYPREPRIVDLGGGELVDESYATMLHLIAADGTNDRVLYDGQGTLSSPAWSPDGTTISFSAADDCPDCAGGAWYATIGPDGGEPETLTSGANAPVHGLDWSPDGTRWVFTANTDYYLYENPGTIATRLRSAVDATVLTSDDAWNPRWSPDGTQIAFLRADGVYVMNADGTDERRILAATNIRGLDW